MLNNARDMGNEDSATTSDNWRIAALRRTIADVSSALSGSSLWTPNQGPSGMIVVARPRPLAAVVGGRIIEQVTPASSLEALEPFGQPEQHGVGSGSSEGYARRLTQVTLGGLVVVSNTRHKEPTKIVGHPDLASGASVQRGDTLYVSVSEAIYRESRGEEVEVHLVPTAEDAEALADLRIRARHRWESDRLPDGWTRPLPPPQQAGPQPSKEQSVGLPDDLRELAERLRSKESRDDD